MACEIEGDIMLLFLTNGFLEAGKTQFLDFTVQQDYFRIEGKTLLIVYEGGNTEYDGEKLKKNKTAAVFVGDMRKLTPQYLNELKVICQPGRVLMEWNGMWNQDDLKLPDDWTIYQQIAIIDGSTFELYVQNMKPLLGAMLRDSELIIMNRCNGIPDGKLATYRRTIHATSRRGEIVLEDKEGKIEQATLKEDLPYNLDADVIEIKPEDCGTWYVDCVNQPERYKNKMVEFTAMVLESPRFPKGQFVPGRMAMTCCEASTTFLGFTRKWPGAEDYKIKQWVKVRVKISIKHRKGYHGEEPTLYTEHMERARGIEGVVRF